MPATRRGRADVADRAGQRARAAPVRPRRRDAVAVGRLLAQRAGVTPAGRLETQALAERARVFATFRRRQVDQLTAAQARFGLDCLDERTSEPLCAMRVVDDEGADPRDRRVTLERRRHLQVRYPGDLALELCDDDPVADDLQAVDSR